jgi:hypothetical protein
VEGTALSALAEIFESLAIRWALIGALAAKRYRASVRLTQDVDVLLAGIGPAGALESALRKAGWSIRSANADGELLRLHHPELGMADFLIAGTQYQKTALLRARVERIADQPLSVLTVEDVIIHKLIPGRSRTASSSASTGRPR